MSDTPIQRDRRMGEVGIQVQGLVCTRPEHPETFKQKREVTDRWGCASRRVCPGTVAISGMQSFQSENQG